MTVWWSQFQEPLFGKPAQHRRHVGEDAFARPPNSFCDIIHDRGECPAPGAAIDDLGGYVINLATSTPVNGCDRTAARVGAQL